MVPGDEISVADLALKCAYEDGFDAALLNVNTSAIPVRGPTNPVSPRQSVVAPEQVKKKNPSGQHGAPPA